MKIVLAALIVAAALLAWRLTVVSGMLADQQRQVQTLTTALADRSKREALAAQTECSVTASRFLSSRGWTAGNGSDYQNHFNARLNKCFVLLSSYSAKDDFRTMDLYDAIEGRHYAMYVGHNICDPTITGNPRRCAMDSGMIWFDGNDQNRPGVTIGFRGLRYGGGAGDETTQKTFLEHVEPFMSQ